ILVASQTLDAALDATVPVALEVPVFAGESLTFQVVADTTVDPARVTWGPTVTYTTFCRPDRNQIPVCGAVSCSLDAQGNPITCQATNAPSPDPPIPGDVISRAARFFYPLSHPLPFSPTGTVLASGVANIDGVFSKGTTAAPVVVVVQGVNRLHFKR